MADQKVVAVVPMRHSSERVKGKNYRSFGGRPLFHRIIGTLLECSTVSEVVIDTDSMVIFEDAARFFPDVRLRERPVDLREGITPMNDVLAGFVRDWPGEHFLQTHCTNPLLRSQTVDKAVRTYFEELSNHDSLFSVTRTYSRFWDGNGKPVNHDPSVLLRSQDMAPFFEENSNLYIFSRSVMERHGNRIGTSPFLFEIDARESVDIDEEVDFLLAEVLHATPEKKV